MGFFFIYFVSKIVVGGTSEKEVFKMSIENKDSHMNSMADILVLLQTLENLLVLPKYMNREELTEMSSESVPWLCHHDG